MMATLRQSAYDGHRTLDGAATCELPVARTATTRTVINMKTATAMGAAVSRLQPQASRIVS